MLEMRDSLTLIHWKDSMKAWLIGLSVARSHVGAYLFCPELAEKLFNLRSSRFGAMAPQQEDEDVWIKNLVNY